MLRPGRGLHHPLHGLQQHGLGPPHGRHLHCLHQQEHEHEHGLAAGFIGVDEIRMFLEKIFTLILHFNFYTHIILVFKFIKVILFHLGLNGETWGKIMLCKNLRALIIQ